MSVCVCDMVWDCVCVRSAGSSWEKGILVNVRVKVGEGGRSERKGDPCFLQTYQLKDCGSSDSCRDTCPTTEGPGIPGDQGVLPMATLSTPTHTHYCHTVW